VCIGFLFEYFETGKFPWWPDHMHDRIAEAVALLTSPAAIYVFWYMGWGHAHHQTRRAVACVLIAGLADLAYLLYSLRPSIQTPTGAFMDVGIVAGALFMLLLWMVSALGVCLRHRSLKRVEPDTSHVYCAPCGYDLTGNVSGVCPECGSPSPAGTPTASRETASQ